MLTQISWVVPPKKHTMIFQNSGICWGLPIILCQFWKQTIIKSPIFVPLGPISKVDFQLGSTLAVRWWIQSQLVNPDETETERRCFHKGGVNLMIFFGGSGSNGTCLVFCGIGPCVYLGKREVRYRMLWKLICHDISAIKNKKNGDMDIT